jgi:hypothetical protein
MLKHSMAVLKDSAKYFELNTPTLLSNNILDSRARMFVCKHCIDKLAKDIDYVAASELAKYNNFIEKIKHSSKGSGYKDRVSALENLSSSLKDISIKIGETCSSSKDGIPDTKVLKNISVEIENVLQKMEMLIETSSLPTRRSSEPTDIL